MTLAPGLHRLEADAYHRDPAPEPSLSSSLARLLLDRSPRHAWHASPRLNPEWEPVEKKTFDIGRAAHRQVLGAGAEYAVIPDEMLAKNGAASTKEAKAFIEHARSFGLAPIKSDEADQVKAMAAAVQDRLAEMKIELDPARSELAAFAEIDGCWCRAMIDNAPENARRPLYDLKTTTDASPEAVVRTVMSYGYDVQAAHYLDTWRAATGEDRAFHFVMVEKGPPHEVAVVELGPEAISMARRKTARAREIWRTCLNDRDWPGYPAMVVQAELPEFFHARWLERESVEEEHRQRVGRDILQRAAEFQAP